jgi:diphthamide biosynthesis protein 4
MSDHYETLGLPTPTTGNQTPATAENIKQAYRLALLKHHPDKHKPASVSVSKPSVDAIKTAYVVLSDPQLRAEYDRGLRLSREPGKEERSFHTGEEVVDLDDLGFDGKKGVWYRACRCGEEKGYVVTEQQLEDEERKGGREVVVGCKGCSLWIRVGFGVVEGEEVNDTPLAGTA